MSLPLPRFPAVQGKLLLPGVFPAPSPVEGDAHHPLQHPDPKWGPFCTFPYWGALLMTLPCTPRICGVTSAPSQCVGVPLTPLSPSQPLPGVCSAPSLSVGIPVTPFPLPSPFPGFPLFPPPWGYPCAPPFHRSRAPYPFMGSPLHLSQEDSQGIPPLPQTGFQQSLS